jgi:hypothetical protein
MVTTKLDHSEPLFERYRSIWLEPTSNAVEESRPNRITIAIRVWISLPGSPTEYDRAPGTLPAFRIGGESEKNNFPLLEQ